jgi:hypothetical protein
MTNRQEEELARFYEEHKDDETIWAKKGRKIRARRGGASTVVQVRLAPEELQEIYNAFLQSGEGSLSAFVRTAALERARSAGPATA